MKSQSQKIDWFEIRKQFEKEGFDKLRGLPGHREVSEELREFRNVISHELPETAPKSLFQKLIKILLKGKQFEIEKIKSEYLQLELDKETRILNKYRNEFDKLKKLAFEWIKKNLSEEELQRQWNAHKTWLPRRYTIYPRQATFQRIAGDTLARFYLIKKNVRFA